LSPIETGTKDLLVARVFFLGPPKVVARPRNPVTAQVDEGGAMSPFHKEYSVPSERARTDAAFASYFRGNDPEAWRRIEKPRPAPDPSITRWPFDINNTSLVMAIELTDSRRERKVLLFPGDAQQASWSSWNKYLWREPTLSGDQQAPITAADLLASTVLYKASHYAADSANPQFGLDLMTHPELTAMIAGNHQNSRYRNLPSPTVVAMLQNMTQGRVIQADVDIPEMLRGAVKTNQLFIDYFVPISQPTAIDRKKLAQNWTAANERRVYLIDKKLAGTIRPEEEAELREIENLMDEYMSTTAPTGLSLLKELRDAVDVAKRPVRRR
jgi:hypothetical protein